MFRLTKYFIENPRIANMAVALLMLAGIFSMLSLQREEMPAFGLAMVTVTTECPGASPEDVEIGVTVKIEESLSGVEDIRRTTGVSMEGRSVVLVELEEQSADSGPALARIRDAVSRAKGLPDTIRDKPLVEEITSNQPMFELAVTGNASERELRRCARDLENRLREIRGVASIEKIGYRKRQVHIRANPAAMKALDVSFADIMQAVKLRNVRAPGGKTSSDGRERSVVTSARYEEPMSVRNVIVRSNFEGYSVRLTDVAVIDDTYEDPDVIYSGNGKPGIALLVTKRRNADTITLSDELRKAISSSKKTLPAGVSISEIYDYSHLTRTMFDIVVNNAVLGFALVIVIILLFMDGSSALWTAFKVPFTFLVSMLIFPMFRINLNVVSLASMIIVIGIIVDDAVVVGEKAYSLRQEGMGMAEACLAAVKREFLPVTASSVTNMIGFLPVLFIPGVMGRFTQQIPVVITITLAVSLFEAFCFLPTHLAWSRISPTPPRRTAWFPSFRNAYCRILTRALAHRGKVLAAMLAGLAAVMAFSFWRLDFVLEKDINPDFFAVIIEARPGTSLADTAALAGRVERTVAAVVPRDAVKSITTQAGHHNKGGNYLAVAGRFENHAIVTVYLKPASERRVTSERIIASLKPRLAALSKTGDFTRLDTEFLSFDAGKAVEVTYVSDNDADRARFETETLRFLGGIRGVSGVETSSVPGKDETRIVIDHALAARMGVTAGDVADNVRTAFDGIAVTSIRYDGEDVEYVVRAIRPAGDGMPDILVANREGRLVPIRHFVRTENLPSPAAIRHRDGRRAVTVTANVDDTVIAPAEVNRMLRGKFERQAAAVSGLSMILGGQEEESSMSLRGFYFALVVALVAIYFLLVVMYRSYLQPALVMSVLPFAVAGVFLTLVVHGRPLEFIALVGLLGLIGIGVNDAIVLIDHLSEECRGRPDITAAIVGSASGRLRPIMLTTLTTVGGLLPTAYGIGGELQVITPFVLPLAWGLMLTMGATLFSVPLMFSYIAERGAAKEGLAGIIGAELAK